MPTYLGAHTVPPEFGDADEYLDYALGRGAAGRREVAEAADVFLERGAFSAEQAERYLRAAAGHGLALRLHGDQFTEAGAIPLADRARRALGRPPRGDRPGRRRALAASDVAAVLLPVAALYLRRCMPPARALIDRGAIVVLATDFNPGSAYCDSLPVVMTLACTQLGMSAGRGARAHDGERGLGAGAVGPAGPARARATTPTSCCSTRPTGATSPTTWPVATSRPSTNAAAHSAE